ncbi:MAG: hypothetical protein JST92_17035 [Deltaproteobacteria bacterium]|nr:hypothetical protein [Deltaproteobacteria bacterium]
MSVPDPNDVRTYRDLAEFVRRLAADLEAHPADWENPDLPRFLEAMGAWIGSLEGYYRNQGGAIPLHPSWRTFAEILAASRIYE